MGQQSRIHPRIGPQTDRTNKIRGGCCDLTVNVEVVEQIIPVKTGKKPVKQREEPRKTAKVYRGPSKQGRCVVCGKPGIRRYMIACDLPQPTVLCDEDYKEIRRQLKTALQKIMLSRMFYKGED